MSSVCAMSSPQRGAVLLSTLFFFNDTATTEIYTLSLHDALPISGRARGAGQAAGPGARCHRDRRARRERDAAFRDRKSTRLNSSHSQISYAVFCLKKKKQQDLETTKPTATTCAQQPTAPRARYRH